MLFWARIQRPLLRLLVVAMLCPYASHAEQQAGPEDTIQQLIDSAYKAGKTAVIIPTGTYHVRAGWTDAHLKFKDMHDFEIDARGVTLMLADPTMTGIIFERCQNVILRGVTLEYAISPATQGVVEAISADGRSYDIRIDKGYPANLDDSAYFKEEPTGYLFNPKTRWWKAGAYGMGAKGMPVRLGPDRFRVTWNQPLGPPKQPVAIGDLIAFRSTGKTMLVLNHSAGMHVDDVTILNAAGMAVRENEGDGGNHYTITVKRGPPLPGEISAPLVSAAADGFHSSDVRKGPVIENSYFEGMMDDGIAIHGRFSVVFRAAGDKLVINGNSFRTGDRLQLYDPDGLPAGEAIVKKVSPLPDFHNAAVSKRVSKFDEMHGPYAELTLDHALHADFDYQVVNAAAVGAGFVIRNNVITHHLSRGMMLKSDDGIVENNVVDGSAMSALVMAPEFWWNEAGYCHHLTVRNNIFRNEPVSPRSMGAVVLTAISSTAGNGSPLNHPIAGYGNQHILFENNTFEDNNGVNLLVTSAQDVKIIGNKFIRPNETAMEARGASWGEVPSATINIFASKDVTLHGNTVIAPGSANKSLVFVNKDAQATGADTGIQLAK